MACLFCNMYAEAGLCPNSGRKHAFQHRMPQPQISVDFAGKSGYNQVGKLQLTVLQNISLVRFQLERRLIIWQI